MRIAIISDSHDNIVNTEKFLAWANENEIAIIIHCGDVSAPSMIKKVMVPMFSGPIHLVHGNVSDRKLLKKICAEFKNVTLHGDEGEIEIGRDIPLQAGGEKMKIAFCHFPERAKKLAQSGQYNLVFYGHTHKPWIENINKTILANPGTLGGLFQKATFAIFDTTTKNLDLKVLEDI
ncbi:MAG: hypothetical protein A3B89_03570 [Candidatus Buchananbacteria bacterium RIFCSPHIGHO2_02_FULL_40_13]|uniref:Phosphoesterase n=1 Tax=Candidatus Buchananbacteria bacterium RIFCSPLOWO2_01_FULL_39_33 TaxID=1797543 RepID=A0A1G1YK96_9BACT|nr:MAG: hypothetical protein A2820_00080 [Candidatus Buchananbacteria bacterium RIFCSPHIGHO2_01_FULL_40_35]OGY50044.1 MAG: hypothetical protein A3B89_03570 [Candidatus Buchananbacteria bacterium RIFCSPHIGHO2_02_FULL_40_13]OGY52701.1 MAG: hypothetical protein A3A02_02575 [Candidatus Buchananbacteria bacterium RIFCSPLOWO2_01_FULL_39_33]